MKKALLAPFGQLGWLQAETKERKGPRPATQVKTEGKCRFGGILFYCQNIDDFLRDFPELSGQKSWVDRFIKHYSKKVDSEDDGVSGGVGTCSGGDRPNSGGGGTNSDHLVTNSGDADGKEANSDRVVTNSGCGDGEEANSDRVVANSGCGDGEEANSDRVVANSGGGDGEESNSDRDGANSDGGGAKSDSAGAKPDKEADKSDRGGANTDGDGDKSDKGGHWRKDRARAARSGGTVVQKAGVSGDDENCERSGDESVSSEVSIRRVQIRHKT
ncbi:hypothetical protein PR003_g2891 [Phytophthora rubi]|uniref:Uncharacterized protein n=1 Tax=Phytophthora rubi TaxID=129364 RepID=A0A6A4FZ92_9STRA|nr:hypothetical protein PR003_g2891 [Phytophthora rubi]